MKKNVFLPILIALLAFGQTAWAQDQVSVSYVDENGTTQTHNAYKLDEFVSVSPSGVNIGNTGFTNWYFVEGNNVVLNGQLGYNGGINLILCDGAKLTVNNTGGNAIQSLDNTDTKYTLTIYVQEQGTGQLVATATGDKAIQTENLTIHGGTISATGSTNGIYAPNSNIVINKGTVTASASAQNGNAIEGYNVTINGGIVSATGNGGIKNGDTGDLILGYTDTIHDYIYASNYQVGYTSSLHIKTGQYLITDDGEIAFGAYARDRVGFLAGDTLRPYTPKEWQGKGTSSEPYLIASVDDLNLLSIRTNGGTHPYSDTCFKLGANITFTASSDWDDATSTENNFTAISGFNGHFNGDDDTISGLRIFATDNYHDQNGFFSNLGPNAYIENLTISDARIAGQSQVGAIAGYVNEGAAVTNCHVTGTVAVHAWGHTLENHGGIVGANYGTVSNCVSEATITRSCIANDYGKTGGIVGTNHGTLSGNKVFNANLTVAENYGAIAGLNDGGTLTNNYYRACTVNDAANVTNMGVNGADVTSNDGALSLHTISTPNTVTIVTTPTLTYNTVNYWAQGKNITLNGGLDDTPTAGWQKAYFVNNVANTSDPFTPSNTFPITPARDIEITIGQIHADWATSGAQGTEQDPYLIYFPDQLDLLATRVNNDNTNTGYAGKYFKLMNNLEYNNTEQNNYTAIGNWSHQFKGCFDGDYKTISGIRIYLNGNDPQTNGYQGIFGYIRNGDSQVPPCEVKNLTIDDADITANSYAGGIVGFFYGGKVTNCHATSTVFVRSASPGVQCHGGIVGTATAIVNAVEISHCTSSATLTNANNSGTGYGAIAGSITNGVSVSDNFAIGATVCSATNNTYGAIVGENYQNNSTLAHNYYHNCTVAGEVNTVTKGCQVAAVMRINGKLSLGTLMMPPAR